MIDPGSWEKCLLVETFLDLQNVFPWLHRYFIKSKLYFFKKKWNFVFKLKKNIFHYYFYPKVANCGGELAQ